MVTSEAMIWNTSGKTRMLDLLALALRDDAHQFLMRGLGQPDDHFADVLLASMISGRSSIEPNTGTPITLSGAALGIDEADDLVAQRGRVLDLLQDRTPDLARADDQHALQRLSPLLHQTHPAVVDEMPQGDGHQPRRPGVDDHRALVIEGVPEESPAKAMVSSVAIEICTKIR